MIFTHALLFRTTFFITTDSAHPDPVTAAQVLLRWTLQHNLAVIPRSSNKQRLIENLGALTIQPLSVVEMTALDTIQYLVESSLCKAINITAAV